MNPIAKAKWTLLALTIPTLIACGGGSGGSSSDNSGEPTLPTPTAKVATQDVQSKVGLQVRLSALGSHVSGDENISYKWALTSQPAGSTATLSSTQAVQPFLITDVAGEYVAELVVTAAGIDSDPIQVKVNATELADNVKPVFELADKYQTSPDGTLTINPNAQDADPNDTVMQTWALTKVDNVQTLTTKNNPDGSFSFTAGTAGEYHFTYTLKSGEDTLTKDVIFEVVNHNLAPIAMAGKNVAFELDKQFELPQEGDVEKSSGVAEKPATSSMFRLDASASYDLEGSDLTYKWAFVSKPENSNAALDVDSIAQPGFIPDVVGDYVLSLVVSDGALESAADYVRVTVNEKGTKSLDVFIDGEQLVWNPPQELQNQFKEVALTYPKSDVPSRLLIGTVIVEAHGEDFHIPEVMAFPFNSPIAVEAVGLKPQDTMEAGERRVLNLYASPTNGMPAMIFFSIKIDSDFVVKIFNFTTNEVE